MKKAQMMMRFEPHQEKGVYDLYIYDNVTKDDKYDWSTWQYVKSKTSAEYFTNELAKIPSNAEIRLFINSNGGSVSEGTAIYNQLKRHPANKTGYVDGCAYSVASLILQACDKRVMGLGTSMLVHNMWIQAEGNANMLRKLADDLDKWMESNRKVYLERCGEKMTEEQLAEIMEKETILTPEECMEYGLIDEIAEELQETAEPEGVKGAVQTSVLEGMQQFIELREKLMQSMQKLDLKEKKPEKDPKMEFFNHFLN